MTTTDTPRTDALMVNGCIAINILEHARTLERELNNTTPTPVWPEIVRLQGKIEDARKDAFNLANALSRAEAEVERLEKQLSESQAQSHGLARRVIQAETMLEVVQRQLKNYTRAIETL